VAEVLDWSPRTLRRWRQRYETRGCAGLLDRRLFRPSGRAIPPGTVERVLRLYREGYAGFNVRHFCEIIRREHGVTQSYSWVKRVLQAAGLVKKHRARGRHRHRREPRACAGELLHIDGSPHAWWAQPGTYRLIVRTGQGRTDSFEVMVGVPGVLGATGAVQEGRPAGSPTEMGTAAGTDADPVHHGTWRSAQADRHRQDGSQQGAVGQLSASHDQSYRDRY
jgi:transposase